ncbi:SGNH hydrolase domain-containing protein [Quadrisphaera sp. DSM 44207]|uniref:SGNH hydrolase domain-containing protein n=1 Tax=Quadrisphaera sp. DSM 44207 TaxID=1881057 RepID=UPI00088D42E6|nr:SGNH hydrolase domain-containing protein [Quadrisphaera sp. DSM 44207]SDQ66718.1 Peptidoglycan/LPS O-acetylase OafA/YrhL, contains acyltransferase and SGNH-hydrolase domains [Quadrisphaera sp. DSM 44207]
MPMPPSDGEKHWYMGRQHRWLLLAQALSFALIAYSIARFATADTRLLLFLVPVALYSVTLLISSLSGARKKRTSLADHRSRVRTYRPSAWPTVDVFLPTAGEPLEVLQNTYHHVSRMQWPATLEVYVLDDGARDDVRALAHEHGFHYLSRSDRGRLKKAGNLRFGYEHSSGDLIAIFDADFVPRPDYLSELVPYFDEPDIGIVQSPQFFDAPKGMHWLQRCAGATQELFYRWIQPARDRARAAICVGTCAIYRRAALEQSGGFAQIGHSEDVHTGVNLMKAGFHVRYVPVLVAKGLCPDTLAGFLNQQYRWCTGSMSLLADKSFHAAEHIRPKQRICFWAGFLYYISTALNAFVAPLPALAMLYVLPQWVEPMNSIWLVGALCLWLFVLPALMKGRWRIDVLRVQLLYSFAHAVAIFDIVTGRTKEWVATGTANGRSTPLATTISRTAKVYVGVTQVLIYVGLVRGTWLYGLHEYWAMIALAVLGAYVHLPLLTLRAAPQPVVAPSITAPAGMIRLPETAVVSAPGVIALPDEESALTMAKGASAPADLRERGSAAGAAVVPPPRRIDVQAPGSPHPHSAISSRPTAGVASTDGAVPPDRRHGPGHFRADVQGLRAVAVILVILYHSGVPRVTGGYVGVDVFFVISGFLITGQLVREMRGTGRIDLLSFYGRRARRLLPPAALVLLTTVVAFRLWGPMLQIEGVALDALFAAVYALNYRLAVQGVDYQRAAGPESPLQHFWSLAVEEQFYILWPVVLMACCWVARRHRTAVITAVLSLICAVSFYCSVTTTTQNAPLAYFSLQTRAWELAAGALVALVAGRLSVIPRSIAAVMSWSGLAAILWSGLSYSSDTPFPGTAALVPVLGAAAVIAAGGRQGRLSADRVLARRPVLAIGDVSYAWYLWHWPLIVIVPSVYGRTFQWWELAELSVVALALAVLTYWIIESPSAHARLRTPSWLGVGTVLNGAVALTAVLVLVTVPVLVGSGRPAVALTLDRSDIQGVKNAVAEGTSISAAPSNLEPGLAVVKDDQPRSTADGCHAGFLVVHQGDCVYGDADGERTMVLVGDSHAQQWLPALDRQAQAARWRVVSWTKAACPMADVDVHSKELQRTYSECSEWRERTIGRIAELHPDVVVVAQSDAVPGTQVSNLDWAEKTVMTVERLRAVDLPVYYLLDTPYPGQDVSDCVAKNLQDVGSCVLPRNLAWPYSGRHETMAETLSMANVALVEPADWFCTVSDCPAVVGNMLVYRDDSHISTSYSAWLAPMFAPLFR